MTVIHDSLSRACKAEKRMTSSPRRRSVTLAGLVLAAIGFAGVCLGVFSSPTLAQGVTKPPNLGLDAPRKLGALNTIPVPTPPNLSDFVQDNTTAIALGKAFFWDQQMGSDGQTACATCHFQAGADVRTKNTISPGVMDKSTDWFGKGPNYQVTMADYPFHRLIDADDTASMVLSDTNDVTGAQGVFSRGFNLPGIPGFLTKGVDSCAPTADPVFSVGGTNVRRVTGRNAPSVIDAAFNFRNFWDGRANNNFNGVNPFGDRDPNAVIFKTVPGSTAPQPVHVSIAMSSLASQAVGPPGSPFEMSCAARIFPNMGRKMLTAQPLGQQLVDPTDSRLGKLSSAQLKPGTKGLNTTYIQMIKKAFKPEYWQSTATITIGSSSPVTLAQLSSDLIKIIAPGTIVPTSASEARKSVIIPTNKYLQIEANFSLFWGLAVQMYEDTLIASDSPVDQYFGGNKSALTPDQLDGLAVFEGPAHCVNCHGGPETTNASVSKVTTARLERMKMSDSEVAVYDDGFYNIGVRPTTEDAGIAGTDPFGNPLSETIQCQQILAKPGGACDPAVQNIVGRPNENLGAAVLSSGDRAAVSGNFKVPGLRNVELTGPYFHNGSQATLRQVVDFYGRGGDFGAQNLRDLDPDIEPRGFSEIEKNDLVAFLVGLTDERVRWEKAPFDHPSLCLPSGATGSMTSVTPDPKNPGQASDATSCLPAVGAAGRTAKLGPVLPFLVNPADSDTAKATFQYQPAPVFTGSVQSGADPLQIDVKGRTSALLQAPPAEVGAAGVPATLISWGQTSPSGMVFINNKLWVSDHVMGLCQLDPAPNTLLTVNAHVCDPNGVIGSPGQPVFDSVNKFVYVPDNSRKSAGIWRLTYHQDTDSVDSPILLDPSLAGLKITALALGPDMAGTPNGALYVGSLVDGGIRRVNNLLDANPRNQWVDIIAHTTDGRGINGSIAFMPALQTDSSIRYDLYLPENRGLTVIRDAPNCFPAAVAFGSGCFPELISFPAVTFVNSVATDGKDKVYFATNLVAPGAIGGRGGLAAQAQIYRFSASSPEPVAELFETQGMNPADAPASTEDCSLTCTRPADAWTQAGHPSALWFVLGMYYDSGTLYFGDDPLAGQRFGSGHVWSVNAP